MKYRTKRNTALSVIMILIAAAAWGIIGIFSRRLFAAGLSVLQITFIRCIIAAAGMGIILLLTDRKGFHIRLRDFWMFLGTGLISIVFFNVCYFLTIQRASLSAASVLLYTAPCFVMLMSAWFFKERITAQKLIALVIAFLGCALASGFALGDLGMIAKMSGSVSGGVGSLAFTGGFTGGGIGTFALLTGLGSGFGYAMYSIFGKVALKRYRPFTVIFYTFVVATVALLPFVKISSILSVIGSNSGNISAGLGLGVISTLLPFVLYTSGLRHIEAGKASVLAFAEPMVATIAGIVIFSEPLYLKNAAGILMIFLAIVMLNIPLRK